jgi:hypothetical protein
MYVWIKYIKARVKARVENVSHRCRHNGHFCIVMDDYSPKLPIFVWPGHKLHIFVWPGHKLPIFVWPGHTKIGSLWRDF